MANVSWDDNLRRVLIAFKLPLTIVIIAAVFYLGWIDVPVFREIVDGLVSLFQAVPGVGG